jgi:hypothetical protein
MYDTCSYLFQVSTNSWRSWIYAFPVSLLNPGAHDSGAFVPCLQGWRQSLEVASCQGKPDSNHLQSYNAICCKDLACSLGCPKESLLHWRRLSVAPWKHYSELFPSYIDLDFRSMYGVCHDKVENVCLFVTFDLDMNVCTLYHSHSSVKWCQVNVALYTCSIL